MPSAPQDDHAQQGTSTNRPPCRAGVSTGLVNNVAEHGMPGC